MDRRDELRPEIRMRPRGRRALLHPGTWSAHHVEVLIARTRREMRALCALKEGHLLERDVWGCCRSWKRRTPQMRHSVDRPGRMVARIYMNRRDILAHPSEHPAHEVLHAAMAWARFRCADLAHMDGEEVLAYALGRMVRQMNRVLFAYGVFPD